MIPSTREKSIAGKKCSCSSSGNATHTFGNRHLSFFMKIISLPAASDIAGSDDAKHEGKIDRRKKCSCVSFGNALCASGNGPLSFFNEDHIVACRFRYCRIRPDETNPMIQSTMEKSIAETKNVVARPPATPRVCPATGTYLFL